MSANLIFGIFLPKKTIYLGSGSISQISNPHQIEPNYGYFGKISGDHLILRRSDGLSWSEIGIFPDLGTLLAIHNFSELHQFR